MSVEPPYRFAVVDSSPRSSVPTMAPSIATRLLPSSSCVRPQPLQTQVCLKSDGPRYHYSCFLLDLKRTRDSAILDTCDIVVDVGAVFDEAKQRFDHHQRGFSEVFGHGFETKLSSAGLIYKYIPHSYSGSKSVS